MYLSTVYDVDIIVLPVLIFYFSPKKNEYTSRLEREIEKLQEDIDTIKRDIDKPGDETMTSMGSTIQAPTNNGPIGEVIAELKAHNYKKHEYKRQQGFITCLFSYVVHFRFTSGITSRTSH